MIPLLILTGTILSLLPILMIITALKSPPREDDAWTLMLGLILLASLAITAAALYDHRHEPLVPGAEGGKP